MATTLSNKILGLGYGLAVASPESAWKRLETVNELILTEDMNGSTSVLAAQLKAYLIEQVKRNLHVEISRARHDLTPKKAGEKIEALNINHNQRFRSLVIMSRSFDQHGSYA